MERPLSYLCFGPDCFGESGNLVFLSMSYHTRDSKSIPQDAPVNYRDKHTPALPRYKRDVLFPMFSGVSEEGLLTDIEGETGRNVKAHRFPD